VVKNTGGHWAGLLYKLTIDGDCEDDYFLNHCRLWSSKNLKPRDKFFNFNDIKPGDWGTNVISYHVYDNDAHVCLIIDETTEPSLSEALEFFVWLDENKNGEYDNGEPTLLNGTGMELGELRAYLGDVEGSTDNYIGLYWCAGEIEEDGCGVLSCDGSEMGNEYQGTKMRADLIFHAVQSRHNEKGDNYACEDIEWPVGQENDTD
jgi:hypothetical protein